MTAIRRRISERRSCSFPPNRVGQLLMSMGWLVMVTLGSSSLLATEKSKLLAEAVDEYRAAMDLSDRDERLARFHRAELLFEQLAAGEGAAGLIRNADLQVNIGNSALGGERIGPAILAYRRALLIDPDHDRARQNLAHARTLLPDWVPRPVEQGVLDTFFSFSKRISRNNLSTLTSLLFFLTALSVAAAVRWRQSAFKILAILPAIGWIVMLGFGVMRDRGDSVDIAVVIVPEVVARSADSSGAPARLPQPLPGGTELQWLESRDDWSRIRLLDGRDAWLPSSTIEKVNCYSKDSM